MYCTTSDNYFWDNPPLALEHFPPAVRGAGRITVTFCRAYANVCRAIASTLKVPGTHGVPTVENITLMLHGWTTPFFRKGARVEHALEYLLTTAAEGVANYYAAQVPQEERVSRLFGSLVVTPYLRMPQHTPRLPHMSDKDYNSICRAAATWHEDHPSWIDHLLENAAYTALPACENDLNLALVALKLGLDNPKQFLPLPPRTRNSDDQEDEEEDAEDEDEDEEDEDEEDEEGYGEEDEEEDVDDKIDESGESEEEDDEVAHEEPSPKRMRMYL